MEASAGHVACPLISQPLLPSPDSHRSVRCPTRPLTFCSGLFAESGSSRRVVTHIVGAALMPPLTQRAADLDQTSAYARKKKSVALRQAGSSR